MANTIGFGQGAVNNTNGYGKSATNNTIDFGEVCADSWSPETNLVGGSSFSDTTSFRFDGIDDKLESVTSFTSVDSETWVGISLWIKIPDVSLATESIIRINNSVSGYTFWAFIRKDGRVDASCNASGSYTRSSVGAITNDTWHHIFFRFDFSLSRYNVLRIFVDGVISHSSSNFSSISSFPSNSSTMFISNDGSSSYANVYVNELAFYTSGDDTLPNEIYNSGSANNLDDNTYTPIVWYRSENATWNGTEWTITDEKGNGVNLLSFNMAEDNRETDVPT